MRQNDIAFKTSYLTVTMVLSSEMHQKVKKKMDSECI